MTDTDNSPLHGHRVIEKRIKSRLRIGDFYPVSQTVFNGEPATEIFFQGCPWECSRCQHPVFKSNTTPGNIDWQDILYYLMGRRGLIDHVVFNGAEPLSQTHVIEAIMQCKTMGFMVGLHTCGIYPLRLESVLPLVDWIWFQVLGLPEHYQTINRNPGSGYIAWHGLHLAVNSSVPVVCELYCGNQNNVRQDMHRVINELAAIGVENLVLTFDQDDCPPSPTEDVELQTLAAKFSQFSLRTGSRITK